MANNEDIAKRIADTLQASPAKTSTPTGVMTESLKATKLAEEAQAQSAAEDAAFMEERRKRQQAEVISGATALPDLAKGSQAISGVKRKPYVDLGAPAPAFGSAAGVGYDAIRDDSISPAQQLDSGAVISDSPNAYPHMGGIVSPGREIYAELPKTEDTFYLKAKYRPITPKPIRMFDGSEFTTNTANMQKAMYQFIVGVKGVKDLDWAGYRMLGPKQEESWAQGFFRSIANSVPQMVVGMAHGTVSLGNDIANVIDLMFHDDKYSKQINAIYNANAAAINEAANDLYQSLRIDYTDITERDTKKPAVMAGNLAGSVVPAILGGPNTLAALALSEGLSGYAGIRNSLRDAGYSPAEAFGMALGGGLAIGGLSYASDWFVDDVQKVLTKSGTSLIKEALYNPKGLAKVIRNVGFKKSLMEAGSEVMQEDIQRLFSGESFGEVYTTQWDERLNIAVGSLLFGLGAAYYQAVKLPAQGERVKKYLESVENLLASNKNVFEQFIDEGIITKESVDAIFAALRNPEAGAAVADIIKDTVIQQFDKIPAEQIQKLQKVLDGIDPNLELDKEFGKLNERVNALLANSNLSAEQKTTVRNFMRGVAAWQLSTMGVLPSQMQLPQSITSERPKGVPASAAGWTSPDGSVIYISTGNTAPLASTQITAGRGSGNLAASRKIGSDISKAASKGAGDLSQSIDVGLTKHELTHWAEKFTGLKNVAEFANAMSKLVSTIIPNYTKGKSGVELSEAFAYAMQYAGNQAKEAIGLAGPVQDHVNFINSMLRANQSAGRITAELKAYFDVLQKVLSTNSQLIDQVLEEWKSPEALRSAIREFIETGDASVLSVDTLRNLSAVLNSVVNGETQDKLATVFESSEQMQEFKDTANGVKLEQGEKDRVEKQDMLAGIRKEANVQVGLPENTKPTAAPTMSEAASEIATEDVELPKAEAKTEAKAEGMPERRKKSGEMYDIDELEVGKMSDQKLVDYRIHVATWLAVEQASGVAPASRISALQRYNELSAAEVAKRKKAKRFTPEQAQALEDVGLYAVFEVQPLYTEKITDALAEIVVEERTPAEQDLYRALVQYEADSNFYKDYEFVSQYEANTRLISLAEELDAKISLISADPKSRARSYINTLEKRIASHIQFLEDNNHDILMNEMLVTDGILEPDYAGTTDDRTSAQKQYDKEIGIAEAIESEAKGFKEASAAKLESLKKTVADLKVAMSRGPKIAKKRVDAALASLNTELLGEANPAMIDIYTKVLDYANRLQESNSSGRLSSIIASLEKEIRSIERSLKDESSVYRFYDATAKAERIRQGAERRLESAKKAPRRSTSRLTPYFTPKYDSDLSVHVAGVRTLDSAYAFLRGGKGTEEDRAGAQRVIQENRVLASHASPVRAFGKRPLLDTPSPLEERGISVEEALQTIANAGLKPYELDVSQITNDFIGRSYNLEGEAPKTRSRIYAKLVDFMLHEDFGMKDIAESGDDAQMMRVLLAIHEAKYLANDMFAQYLGREQSFDKHPSLHPISPAAIDFAKSERGQAQMKDHKQNRGYSEVALAHMLEEGDHVAFPYGNNYFRGIISFKGKTPSGATTYVIRRDIDVAEWKDKELTSKTRGLEEYVIAAEEFYKVGILRKPVRSIDPNHIKEVFDFYDSAFEKMGRVNWTQRGIMSRTNEDADIFDAIDPLKKEIAEELRALDAPTDGLFAAGLSVTRGDESGALNFINDIDMKLAETYGKIEAAEWIINSESYFNDWEGFQADKPESIAAEKAARESAISELKSFEAERDELQKKRKAFFGNYTPEKREAFIVERERAKREMDSLRDRYSRFFDYFGEGLTVEDVDLTMAELEGRNDVGFQDKVDGSVVNANVILPELRDAVARYDELNTYFGRLDAAIKYGASFADLRGGVPTIDPGLFAVIGGSLEDTMAAYERSMELEEEYAESGLWYEGKSEQEAILAAELARREDQLKPKFSDAVTKKNERGVSFIDQLDMLEKGLAETRVSKALYFLGSGSGTDRKGRLLFGKVWDKAFGLSKAYSYAQQRREMRVHLMDEVVLKDVFGGNQKAYDKWRAEIKADRYDAVVNGDKVKISRDEIMSIYAMKLASERPGSSNNQLSRLRKYSNIDGLIANLTAEDKKFVEKAVVEIRAAREGISSVPTDWVPAVEMTTFRKDGWAGRKKSKINNERSFVESDTSIAALGLYDSTISSISRFATHASGLMAQLDNLKQILAFAGIDKSMYREFDTLGEDQKLYDEILDRSTKLREAIAKKIGHTQAKWLLQGIEYDLTADPLSDDIGTAPGMEWFQKLTRGAASSAMSLNLRQALQNLGNYHRFFGLSSSGGVKFYTADWINAVAHIKEAWALAMENPEFKRRFEQAGLSEHMRRIADVNQPSFLGEIQTKLFEKGKDGASDLVGTLNSLSAIGTKWGLATNVLPDMVGIALGNYAVWNDVLAKNGGNAAQAQKEIADFVNNRISSSNYMTQSLLKKRLNKMGLGALVMFQSDQLQSFGALAEAWSTLLNSKDANERSVAKRDIASFVVSMGRYIAIKAGWVGALMATAMGRDLSDDEWEYIYESTAYEMVAQMGGWSQFNNLGISPFIRSLMEGENFGPSIVTVSATGRLISGVRKGFKGDGMSFVDALGEALALSGIAPAFPALLRISDGIFKIASGDEHESAVGWKQVTGTSETGAMQQLGLSKSKKTGKIQPKKKLKKDGE